MKTRTQLDNELYLIVKQYGDIRIIKDVIKKAYPKSRGNIHNLTNEEYELLIPLIREAYERNKIN